MPDEAQAVHEKVPSNATPKCTVEAEYDTVWSKIKVYDPYVRLFALYYM